MISVITAIYNHAPFIRGAVASLRAQDFQDWEHIIIDDGSTDETPRILAELGQAPGPDAAKLRLFRTGNQGLPAALNLGLAQARGELIAFLDADDEYLPNHLSHLTETLADRDFALGRFVFVNCSADPAPVVLDFFHPGQVIPVQQIEFGTGVFFGRKEVFTALAGFRQVGLSDTDFFTRMTAAGYAWSRAAEATYRYFFGRVPNNMATREVQAARLGERV
jgi:glycosyltransferase involved in cell wall biosynthesis